MSSTGAFTAEDVIAVASVIDLDDGTLVVGGQALNLWAERFAARTSELMTFGPFTSKDIGYFGYREAAAKLPKALGGKVSYPSLGDATPSEVMWWTALSPNAGEQR